MVIEEGMIKMGKRILCIGDSNTWGYIPGSGERYEKNVRWTGKLAQTLGENYEVIEEGMNGRTTAFTDKIEPGTAALDYLYPCLISQFPLDYIIVMLGTNDTKTRYGVNTVEIGYGLDEVLLKIEETCRRKSQTPEKIVIAPADLYPKKDWIEFTAESAQKAGGLTEEYRSIAALHHAAPPLRRSTTHCGAASATGDTNISINCSFRSNASQEATELNQN